MNNSLEKILQSNCSNSTITSIEMLLRIIECTAEDIEISKGFYSVIKYELMNALNNNVDAIQSILDSVKKSFNITNDELLDGFKEVDEADSIRKYVKNITPFIISTEKEEKEIFDNDEFIRFIINAFNIVSIDNKTSFYDGKKYSQSETELNRLISNILTISKAKKSIHLRKEFIDDLRFNTRKVEKNSEFLISCENGIIHIKPNTAISLLPHSNKCVITNAIPHKFNKTPSQAALDNVNNLLNAWANNDEAVKQNIIEVCAYCLFPDNRLKKVIFIYGPANGGKSLFLKFLKNLLGKENTSSVKLHQLADRFELFHCEGKLANISDEISSRELSPDESNSIKDLSSEAEPKIEHKGKDSIYSPKFSTKLIFGCNDIPMTKDRALFSRFLIIPFLNSFKAGASYETVNKMISNEEILEAFLYLVVFKSQEMLNKISCVESPFTESSVINEYTSKYLNEIDQIKNWIEGFDKEILVQHFVYNKESENGITVDDLKSEFESWLEKSCGKKVEVTRSHFMDSVCKNIQGLSWKRYQPKNQSVKIYIFYSNADPFKSIGKNSSMQEINW